MTIPHYLPDRNLWVCWLYHAKVWEHIPGYESTPLILFQVRYREHKWRDLGNDIGFYFKALAFAYLKEVPFYAYLTPPNFKDKLHGFVRWMPTALTYLTDHPYFKDTQRPQNFTDHLCSDQRLAHLVPHTWDFIIPAIAPILRSSLLEWIADNGYAVSELQIDLSLHLRCGDVLDLGKSEYGFFTYRVLEFLINLRIRKKRSIVIETNALQIGKARSFDRDHQAACKVIVEDLASWLRGLGHTVLVADGGEVSASWARMVFSRQLICSSSTFCFWPALVAQESYFPDTGLVIKTRNIQDLAQGWHWVSSLGQGFLASETIRGWSVEKVIEYLRTM